MPCPMDKIRPMSLYTDTQGSADRPAATLAAQYGRWTFWYFVGMAVLSWLGIEALYGHPTPFYATFSLAGNAFLTPLAMLALFGLVALGMGFARRRDRRLYLWLAVWVVYAAFVAFVAWLTFDPNGAWRIPADAVLRDFQYHLLALAVFLVFLFGVTTAFNKIDWFEREPSTRATAWTLVGLIFFSFAFSGAIAMLREGTLGIAQAYLRYRYEYIGDIGTGGSIHGLFANYVELHRTLSLHAQVHPPGPIALLWMLSYAIASREALDLSLATMAVGSLAVVPLYFWAKDLLGRRAALTACLLYTVMPSIVLFTATSADILFLPFTVLTLFLFQRAIDRPSIAYALAAGVAYAVSSLLSFSLLSLGVYFGLLGLWHLRDRKRRYAVVQTAAAMSLAFLAMHLAVRLWSGFDVVETFYICKAKFDADQAELQVTMPRYPAWTFRFLNPLAWVYFAGIPVSLLFFRRVLKPEADTKALFVVFALTLVGLDILYLARGEGERSAMYILPFVVLPAAHLLNRLGENARSLSPLAVTLAVLALQCWLTETFFYTFW
jgi:hypothetical protein